MIDLIPEIIAGYSGCGFFTARWAAGWENRRELPPNEDRETGLAWMLSFIFWPIAIPMVINSQYTAGERNYPWVRRLFLAEPKTLREQHKKDRLAKRVAELEREVG